MNPGTRDPGTRDPGALNPGVLNLGVLNLGDVVPLAAVTRGGIVESLHLGALAVVDAEGRLVAQAGSPDLVSYLRSTAKPLQALALIESGAADALAFGAAEIAIVCGSHSGSDAHVARVLSILERIGLDEGALRCGTHVPGDRAARERLAASGAAPRPAQHNCSGKHSGMLTGAVYRGATTDDYLAPQHPVQQAILAGMAGMTSLAPGDIHVGVDGCSAPTFALPLRHVAWAFARLMDPQALPEARAQACRRIVAAMQAEPVMVSGVGQLDTVLMETLPGRLIVKGGAEGYCGIGLAPGALTPGSRALGIAFKVIDGDLGRARGPAAVETLRQLGLFAEVPEALQRFHTAPVKNYREIVVGDVRPAVQLVRL